jgi:predicted MFS family arabinose efflux permease
MKDRTLPFVLAAAGIFALTMGIRQSQALFIGAINSHTGIGIATISLAFACAQLMWGVTQPIAVMFADRYGPGRVIAVGALAVGAGTALTPYAGSALGLILLIGVITSGGAGAAGPSVLIAAIAKLIPAEKRGFATGVVNAGGSFGQFAIAPLSQALIGGIGWMAALGTLGFMMLAALPLAFVLRGRAGGGAAPGPAQSLGSAVSEAMRDPSFLLLSAGFFVCGFHVAFIAVHMPGVIALCGLAPEVGAWSLAVIGLFNIAGSFAIGWAVSRWRMKSLLSLIYAARALAVLAFLAAPKTEAAVLVFSAVIGVTYLSTVPPTAGLVAKFYGPRYMATLFGLVMLSHQIGGFLGAWLGGRTFEATSSYDLMWYADIALAIAAALVHLPIREKPVEHRASTAA